MGVRGLVGCLCNFLFINYSGKGWRGLAEPSRDHYVSSFRALGMPTTTRVWCSLGMVVGILLSFSVFVPKSNISVAYRRCYILLIDVSLH